MDATAADDGSDDVQNKKYFQSRPSQMKPIAEDQVMSDAGQSHVQASGNLPPQMGVPHGAPSRTDTIGTMHGEDISQAWKKVNILTFDGGGIRGYWSLLALEKLMEHIARYEKTRNNWSSFSPLKSPQNVSKIPLTEDQKQRREHAHGYQDKIECLPVNQRYLPCHYFDYMFGSSTGALIAVMLSRFRMTVQDCKSEYETLGNKVFGKPRTFTQIRTGIIEQSKYNSRDVEKVFQEVCEGRCGSHGRDNDPSSTLFPTPSGTCKTYVITYRCVNNGTRDIFPIRSYRRSGNSSHGAPGLLGQKLPNNFEAWQVARAAIAAPLFFEPLLVQHKINQSDSQDWSLTDGGSGQYNNPTELGITEIQSLGNGQILQNVVSIGTARAFTVQGKRRHILALIKNHAAWGANPEDVHQRISERQGQDNFEYFRLNDPGALAMDLDDWRPRSRRFGRRVRNPGSRTLEDIRTKFREWSSRTDVYDLFQSCAENLVEIRIARAYGQKEACTCVLERGGIVCESRTRHRLCESMQASDLLEDEQVRFSLWERFALNTEYHCSNSACEDENNIFQRRHKMERHLREHGEDPRDILWKTDSRRVEWHYPRP